MSDIPNLKHDPIPYTEDMASIQSNAMLLEPLPIVNIYDSGSNNSLYHQGFIRKMSAGRDFNQIGHYCTAFGHWEVFLFIGKNKSHSGWYKAIQEASTERLGISRCIAHI
jgi:hypothetical protein